MNIYVGNLSNDLKEDELKAMFKEFGEVESVKIIKDRFSEQPRGYGFVDMPSNSEADQAIKALNGTWMNGASIKVNQADPGGKRKSKKSIRRRR